MVNQKIILASTSPRRKELLKQIGLNFEAIPSGYEEDMTLKLSPSNLAKILAYGKAKEVADKLKEGIVIGVDTFLVFGNKRLGKPKDKNDAYKMLKSFSGRTISVYSGVALIDSKSKKEIVDYEVSKIRFRELEDKEIKAYIKTGEPMGKAGAIAIQGIGAVFIEEIKGCYSNIVGLPITNLYKNLKKMGVDVF